MCEGCPSRGGAALGKLGSRLQDGRIYKSMKGSFFPAGHPSSGQAGQQHAMDVPGWAD